MPDDPDLLTIGDVARAAAFGVRSSLLVVAVLLFATAALPWSSNVQQPPPSPGIHGHRGHEGADSH